MSKKLAYLLLIVGSFCTWPLVTGCEPKVTSVERSESIHESEPQMVSPGKEKLE